MNLAELLAGAAWQADGFSLAVPENWHQGRTAYGGLSAALALAAARHAGGDLPPLRSAQVSFVGPLHGTVEVRAEVLRRGRNATWIRADVLRADDQGGEVGLTASFVFMGPIDSAVRLAERPLPAGAIAPEDARPVPTDRSPLFLQNHFDVRFALPRGEGPRRAEARWWVRLRERESLDPMVHLLAIADALPPAVMPFLPPRAPVSSMTWQCNLLHPAPATRDGWWLLRVASDHAESGGASDAIDVWNADGVPVLAGMQSVAVFG